MKNQAFFSSKDKSEKLKCRLLQFLFGALRVKILRLMWLECACYRRRTVLWCRLRFSLPFPLVTGWFVFWFFWPFLSTVIHIFLYILAKTRSAAVLTVILMISKIPLSGYPVYNGLNLFYRGSVIAASVAIFIHFVLLRLGRSFSNNCSLNYLQEFLLFCYRL